MLYGEELVIESSLAPAIAFERIRQMVASRQMIHAPRFRRRQVLGWGLKEQSGSFSLRPEYGDAASAYGTRFEGRVEAFGSGSRIAGHVVLSRLSRVIMSVWFAFVAFAMLLALREGEGPAIKGGVLGGGVDARGGLPLRVSLATALGSVGCG